MRRGPRSSAAAIAIGAPGIGVNTAKLSVVYVILFRPLDFKAAERLGWVAKTGAEGDLFSVTKRAGDYKGWKRMNRFFEDMAGAGISCEVDGSCDS